MARSSHCPFKIVQPKKIFIYESLENLNANVLKNFDFKNNAKRTNIYLSSLLQINLKYTKKHLFLYLLLTPTIEQ